MFSNWFEEYRRLAQKTRFLSQLGGFFVSLFAFLSCAYIFRAFYYEPEALNPNWNNFLISVIFHLFVGVLFALRFISSFFISGKAFVISQILWLTNILVIAAYHTATRFAIYGSFYPPESNISFGMDDYPTIFLYAENSFAALIAVYFFTSPIRQFITLIIAFIKSR